MGMEMVRYQDQSAVLKERVHIASKHKSLDNLQISVEK
jgi:hypothetical protein